MSPKSLVKLTTEACIANIRQIFDVGDAPYHVVRPILLKLENPQQLSKIEENSPQICGHDAELWRAFIKRDIPNWESKRHEPKNPQKWWKVYRKLKLEVEKNARQSVATLKAALNEHQAEKKSQTITFDHSLQAPKRRKLNLHSGADARPANPSVLTFRSGSRTKTTTGKGLLQKARREAREASYFAMARPYQTITNGTNSRDPNHAQQVLAAKADIQPRISSDQESRPVSVQATREEASRRREAALAQQRLGPKPLVGSQPPTKKPPALDPWSCKLSVQVQLELSENEVETRPAQFMSDML